MAACLLIAWIHVDCVNPNMTGIVSGDRADLLVTTVLLGGLTQVPRATRLALDRHVMMFRSRASVGRSGEIIWLDEFQPRCWVLASHLYSLRAPPA